MNAQKSIEQKPIERRLNTFIAWCIFLALDMLAFYCAAHSVRTSHWIYFFPGGGFAALFNSFFG